MADKIELTPEQLQEAVEATKGLRTKFDEMEKGLITKAEFKAYQDKAEKGLEDFDKAHNDLVVKQVESEKKEAELKDRIGHLEMLAGNLGSGKPANKKEETAQIMNALFRCSKKAGNAPIEQMAVNNPVLLKAYYDYIKETNMDGWDKLPPEVKAFKDTINMQSKASPDVLRTEDRKSVV